jgi:hypothetical protein
MQDSKLRVLLTSALANMKAAAISLALRTRGALRSVMERAATVEAQRPLTFEEHVERLLLMHAPRSPSLNVGFIGRTVARRYLRRKRHEFFLMFDRFKGKPSIIGETGEATGRPALINRRTRRVISQRLRFAI